MSAKGQWQESKAFVGLLVEHLPHIADVGGPSIAVYLYLVRCGKDAFPSQARTAEHTGLTMKQVNRAVEHLTAKGWMVPIHRGRRVHYRPAIFDLQHPVRSGPPPAVPGGGRSAPPSDTPRSGFESPGAEGANTRFVGCAIPAVPGAEVRTGRTDGSTEEKEGHSFAPFARNDAPPKTGADAPERTQMPSPTTDQWQDTQTVAEGQGSTTDERPTDATDPPQADATSPSAEKPDATDATTPSNGGGAHAGEPPTAPATPPPHCAPPPATQQEARQGAREHQGTPAHVPHASAPPAPAGFVLEPPAPAGRRRGKAECPPATLAHLRAAWCKHVGGRAGMVPAGFAEACAELVYVCRGDLDLVERAFRGFALSDWHMGRDEKSGGKKWCHPKYVVRSLDEFLSLADEADAPKGKRAEAHLAALQDIAEMRAQHVPAIEQEILRIPRSEAADVVRHGLDHAGTVRGVRVAYRAERAEDDSRGTRQFAAFTLRYATNQVLCGMTAERWGADSAQARAQRTITQSFRLALQEVAAWHARHNAEVDAVLDAAVVPPEGFDPAAAISACASGGEQAQEDPPASAPQEVVHA